MSGQVRRIGFIGVGVMGEPICRHLAAKSGAQVIAFDRDCAPLQRLDAHGVRSAASLEVAVQGSDVIFLSLPSGEVVYELTHGENGMLALCKPGQIVIDLSTSSPQITRELAADYAQRGTTFIDAPVARTRAAADAGQLSVMVGAEPSEFKWILPLLATFASDVTLCGKVGCGQVVKILNNMLLFQIVASLCQARTIGESAGVDPGILFDTLAKGSADSFALRNHGMKAVLPDVFPLRAFSVKYAQKDLKYGLGMAQSAGIEVDAAHGVNALFERAIEQGMGDQYWPVISRLIRA